MSSTATYRESNLHEEDPRTASSYNRAVSDRDYHDSRDYSRDNYRDSRNYNNGVYNRGGAATDDGTHSGKWTSSKELSDRDMYNRRNDANNTPSDWNINVGPVLPRTAHNQAYGIDSTGAYGRDTYDYDNHPSTLSSLLKRRSSSRNYDRDVDYHHSTSSSYTQPRTYTTTQVASYPASHYQYSTGSSYPQYATGYPVGSHYGSQFGGQHQGGLGSFLTSHPNPHPLGGDYSSYSTSAYSQPRGYSSNNFIDFDDYSYGAGQQHYGAGQHHYGPTGYGSHFGGSQGQFQGLGHFLSSNPNPHPIGASSAFGSSSRGFGGQHFGGQHYGGYGQQSHGQLQGLGHFLSSNPNPHPIGASDFSDSYSSSRGFGGYGSQQGGLGAFLTSHPNPHPLTDYGYSAGQFETGFPQQSSRGFSSSNPFAQGYGQQSGFKNKQHKIDLYQVSNDYIIEMDLPSFSRDSVEIKYINNELVISAKPPVREISNFMQRERKVREVYRKVSLPTGVNVSGITAVLANGVLKVTVPRDNASTISGSSTSSF